MTVPTAPAAPTAPPLWRRARPLVIVVAALAVVAGLLAWGVTAITSGPATYRVSAVFDEAPGIYSGNAVTVLGVRVGSVVSVRPGADGVTVAMDIDRGTSIPTDAKAYLMAPNVVNDRFVELDPAYTGGAALPAGTTIGLDRTVTPLSVDDILASVKRLSDELGPTSANAKGALSRVLHSLASVLGGNGGALNASVKNVGDAFAAVSSNAADVTNMLDDLGGLTHAAAGVSDQYEQLAGDLAQVSTLLADDHTVIGQVLQQLGGVLQRLNTFVHDNRTQLKGTLDSLSKVAASVGGKQKALAQALDLLPLALQNVGQTIGPDSNITARFDRTTSSPLDQQVCGDSVLRLLLVSLDQPEDQNAAMDLACGANELLQHLGTAPGSPDGSNFTLKALMSLGS